MTSVRLGLLSWRGFMVVRLVRLYPLIFLGTVLGGFVFIIGQIQKTHQIDPLLNLWLLAGSLLLIPVGFTTHVGGQAYPLNLPVWSLFFELAVGALYCTRFGRLSTRGLINVLALSAVCLIVAVAFWKGDFGSIGFATPFAFLLGFVRVSYPFWCGVALYRFSAQRFLPSLPFSLLCLLLGSILVLPFFARKLPSLTVVLFVFPVIVAIGAKVNCNVHLIRFCSAIGQLSYPVYLIHQPIFRIVKNFEVISPIAISPMAGFCLGSLLSVIGSQALLIVYDRPVRRWLTVKLSKRHKSEAVLNRA